MAGEKTGVHGWVQTAALATPLLLAVLAFFGIKNSSDWFGNSSATAMTNEQVANLATPVPTPTAPPTKSATTVNDAAAVAGLAATVTAEPFSAAMTLTAGKAASVAVVMTVKLHNTGKDPVTVAWRNGRQSTLDLSDGTHMTIYNSRAFVGVLDCGSVDAGKCLARYGTRIEAGQSVSAQITFFQYLKDKTIDPAAAAKGNFISTIIVAPPAATVADTKQVTLDAIAVTAAQ